MNASPLVRRTKVLITVMTYPHPSRGYRELVCTAGLVSKADGGWEWVRLYPIDLRYRPPQQRFRKWQWVEVDLFPHGAGSDNRRESRKPVIESIVALKPEIGVENQWRERRRIVDALPHHTVRQLHDLFDSESRSLGVVRPARIHDLDVTRTTERWKPEWEAMYNEIDLFEGQPKKLAKIPYKFQYVFECEDDNGKPHKALIEDWELGVLYLRELDRLGSEQSAADSVRAKYLEKLCASDRDTQFFMGTTFPYNTWIIAGVFWPPRVSEEQADLFET